MTATEVFELAVSCYLREMDDSEFDALVVRTRGPQVHSPVRRNVQRRKQSKAVR